RWRIKRSRRRRARICIVEDPSSLAQGKSAIGGGVEGWRAMFDTTKARDQVAEIARSRPAEALRVARTIADPWFAVQALAWVARFAPDDIGETALAEASETAKAGRDAYQRSAVLAWPIRAAIETGRLAAACKMIENGLVLL